MAVQPGKQVHAAHFRHLHVQDHDVRAQFLDAFDSRGAAVRLAAAFHQMAQRGQLLDHAFPDQSLVVDNQIGIHSGLL